MKDNIILFIIGVLVGAIISTGAFLVYTKTITGRNCNNQQMRIPEGNPPSMPNGNGQPPEMPDGNGQNNN